MHIVQGTPDRRLGWPCPFECGTFDSGKEVMEHCHSAHPGRLNDIQHQHFNPAEGTSSRLQVFHCPHVTGPSAYSPPCVEKFYKASLLMEHREKVHTFNGIIYDSVHPWFDPASGSHPLGGTYNPELIEDISRIKAFKCPHLIPVPPNAGRPAAMVDCTFVTIDLKLHCLHRVMYHGYLAECEPRDSIHPWMRDGKVLGGTLTLDYVKWWRRTNWHFHHQYLNSLSTPQYHDSADTSPYNDDDYDDGDEDKWESVSVAPTEVDEDTEMTSQRTDSMMSIDSVATPRIKAESLESPELRTDSLTSLNFDQTSPILALPLLAATPLSRQESWQTDTMSTESSGSTTPVGNPISNHRCRFCVPGFEHKCVLRRKIEL